MHPLIENNREAVSELCRLHGVRKMEVFGSILRADFDPQRSDVDVLVEFDEEFANSFANFRLSMPQRDPGVYLEDIEHYAAAAVRFISNYRLEQYLADEKTRAAVERVLEICGEAMNGLHKAAPAIAEKIPHARDIIGFRNILAHGYPEPDHYKVYDIAVKHAPELLSAVKEALKAFPDPTS